MLRRPDSCEDYARDYAARADIATDVVLGEGEQRQEELEREHGERKLAKNETRF